MEDDRGARGNSDSGGVSGPPLSGKLADESLEECMDSDNQVEEVFEEGDGEEIMVEVVGSDVFVDGVSGNGEGDCEMAETGDLEDGVVEKNEESTDVSREGDGNKMDEGGLGSSESRDEKHSPTKEVDTSLMKSVDAPAEKVSALPVGGGVGVNHEAWNPGIETVDGLSVEVVVPPAEVAGVSPMDISVEKETNSEAVDKDISDIVIAESSNRQNEAVSDEKIDLAEEKEILPPSDNFKSDDPVDVDSLRSAGGIEETRYGNDGFIGQVDAVNSSGGKLIQSGTQKDGSLMVEAECASTDGESGTQGKPVSEVDFSVAESKDSISKPDATTDVTDVHENDVIASESKDSIPKLDAPTDVLDESRDSSDDLHCPKLETDGASHAGPESIQENSRDTQRGYTVGNDECLKTGDDLEATKSQNDDSLDVDVKDDVEKNVQIKTSMSGPTDDKILLDKPIVSTMVGAETGDRNVAIPLVKNVNGGSSGEKGMDIDSEVLGKSFAGNGSAEIPAHDDSAENLPLPEKGASSEVKKADAMVTEDTVPCQDPNSEGVADVVGGCCSLQSMQEVVALQVTEASSYEADKPKKTEMMPNEVSAAAADSGTAQVADMPEGNGNTELLKTSTDILLDKGGNEGNFHGMCKSTEADEMIRESNGFCVAEAEGHYSEAKPMEVEDERDAETATEGASSESDKLKLSNLENVKYAGSLRMKQSGYLMPPEDEGCFAPSDLVWGKVRSHPWWPGQIFDMEDASEKAVKHHKKDSYLVAYFGDQTFAWNDSSALKPFRSYFSQIEKLGNTESFQNAVDCALEEVERRVQLGLSCSCLPKDDYAKIETQVVENTGIREESSQRYGVDESSCASRFEPSELLEFIRSAAPCASSGADRLDLVIARAQLSAYCSFKGYRSPIEFPSPGELLEIDGDTEQTSDEAVASHKPRQVPKEDAQSRKERSLMELMGDEFFPEAEDDEKSVSMPTGRKRKALDPLAEGSDKRVNVSAAVSQAPKPLFKIGECIRRVANQLTGSTSLMKGSSDDMAVDGSSNVYEPSEKQSAVATVESLSASEMLSQLELLAQEPKRRNIVQNQTRAFFMGFRSSTAPSRRGRKKKSEQAIGGSGEEFEFDDVNDSYWTDRIVQNYSAEQLLHERMNGAGSLQLAKAGRKPHSRKRFFSESSTQLTPEVDENAKRIKQESSPAELILSFAETRRIPSEISLNKMFRRFGPLMESETQVDHESGSAKVIFKRGSDAEVALNSAEKFSIFGPAVVSYKIGYSPVTSVKILPVSLPQPHEEATLML